MKNGLVGVLANGNRVGQSHHRARFTDHEIDLMRDLRDDGMTMREIAEKFGTSVSTIQGIVSGSRRTQIADRWRPLRIPRRR